MEYAFHIYNKLAADGMLMATEKLLQQRAVNNPTSPFSKRNDATPVIVCVGSDLAIGDSLGPIAGSMLKYKTQGNPAFIYGTLSSPVTAKEIKYLRAFLKDAHPKSPVIAVDAAVGEENDVGLIKVNDQPLKPGSGASKDLGKFGDITVMGVVAEKSIGNYALLHSTRLRLVYKMAEQISDALASVLWERKAKNVERTIGKNG